MSALALLPFLLTFYPLLIMWTSYVTMLWWLKAGNYMGLILFPLPHLYVNFTSSSLTVLLLSGFQSGIPHGVLLKYFLGLLRSVTTSCFFFFSFWCGPFLKSLLSLLTVSLLFYVLVNTIGSKTLSVSWFPSMVPWQGHHVASTPKCTNLNIII